MLLEGFYLFQPQVSFLFSLLLLVSLRRWSLTLEMVIGEKGKKSVQRKVEGALT